MTSAAWTPEGRRSCRSYVMRAFAVMLCCVLCLGLIQPPKSKAVVAEVGLVVAGSVAAAPVAATIGLICLAVVGVGFVQGAFDNTDSIYYGTAVYDWGYKFSRACEAAGGAVHDWYVAQVAACADGLAAGQQIEVPAEVAEYARQWAVQNIDFSSGAVTVTQQGIMSNEQFLVFTHLTSDQIVTMESNSWGLRDVSLGTLFTVHDTITFPDYIFHCELANSAYMTWSLYGNSVDLVSIHSGTDYEQYYTLVLYKGHLIPLRYTPSGAMSDFGFLNGYLTTINENSFRKYLAVSDISSVVATITKDPALDVPITDDLVATIPDDIPFVQVEDKAIPVISELTREDVLTGEVVEPTTPPTTIPGEQTQVGDIALEDIQAQQASLGSVFISKFPFSIPWDFAAAVELLAAPPKTPHWEVDFFAPVAQRYGGWKGDTTIVIDFSDYEMLGQLCRWVTTIMFCSALISGTKRLIWTA